MARFAAQVACPQFSIMPPFLPSLKMEGQEQWTNSYVVPWLSRGYEKRRQWVSKYSLFAAQAAPVPAPVLPQALELDRTSISWAVET